jgi:hypothetical protein
MSDRATGNANPEPTEQLSEHFAKGEANATTEPSKPRKWLLELPSQVIALPIAKSQTRNKQNKDMYKCSSVAGGE